MGGGFALSHQSIKQAFPPHSIIKNAFILSLGSMDKTRYHKTETTITTTAAITIRPALLKFLLFGSALRLNDQYRRTATLRSGTRAIIMVPNQPGTEIGLTLVSVTCELILRSSHSAIKQVLLLYHDHRVYETEIEHENTYRSEERR